MKIAAGRIGPACRAIGGNRVRREAVEILRLGILIRIARQNLSLAIDEYFFGLQVRRYIRLNDPIAIRLPVQFFEPQAAANHRCSFAYAW